MIPIIRQSHGSLPEIPERNPVNHSRATLTPHWHYLSLTAYDLIFLMLVNKDYLVAKMPRPLTMHKGRVLARTSSHGSYHHMLNTILTDNYSTRLGA